MINTVKYGLLMAIFCLSSYSFSHEISSEHEHGDCLEEVLKNRHSGRSYDPSKSVSLEQIKSIIEAARSAPSCYNDQPWRFIICDRQTSSSDYTKVFNTLVEFNQNWAKNAPVLVVIVAHKQFSNQEKPNRWGSYDTGAAAFGMMLQATSLGLMAHQMGGFDEGKIQKEFNIPEEFVPMSVMTLGYESQEELNKPFKRERRPIQENFFMGKWGNGFKE